MQFVPEGRPPKGMCSCGGELVDGECPFCRRCEEAGIA